MVCGLYATQFSILRTGCGQELSNCCCCLIITDAVNFPVAITENSLLTWKWYDWRLVQHFGASHFFFRNIRLQQFLPCYINTLQPTKATALVRRHIVNMWRLWMFFSTAITTLLYIDATPNHHVELQVTHISPGMECVKNIVETITTTSVRSCILYGMSISDSHAVNYNIMDRHLSSYSVAWKFCLLVGIIL